MIAGDIVMFVDKVFEPPYTPYYDEYRGHRFAIVALHHDQEDDPADVRNAHFELECLSDHSLKVKGHVHWDELKRMSPVRPL